MEWIINKVLFYVVTMYKVSQEASARVREKKYHHRVSRRGYANTEIDLVSVQITCICIMRCTLSDAFKKLTITFMF